MSNKRTIFALKNTPHILTMATDVGPVTMNIACPVKTLRTSIAHTLVIQVMLELRQVKVVPAAPRIDKGAKLS